MNINKIAKGVILISILILPFLVYFFFVYGSGETFFNTLDYVGPKQVEEKTLDGEKIFDTIYYTPPAWEFTTQDDTSLSSNELRGRITLVNFFFATCPSICPAMNYNVKQVQDRFKGYENFRIVSFTVNPEHDTVEVLKRYEKKIGAIPGTWYFLTGEREKIYQTANNYFLSAMEDSLADGGFLHSENLVLLDWEGRIRSGKDDNGNLKGVYNGLSPDEINSLKSDIKVLIAEYEKKKSVDEYRAQKELKKKDR